MKILLVDAGATKTDFTLLSDNELLCRLNGPGINPNYLPEAEIMRIFADFVRNCPESSAVEEVLYYGAGCASVHNVVLMEALIARFFPLAVIHVYSDLLAVCHALSCDKMSIVAILGTGSASCLFTGSEIVHQAPSLGYMLGDEGSGTNLGKRLLTCFLNGQLPDVLAVELKKTYNLSFDKIIHRLYKEPEPNRLMSQLAPFVQHYIEDPFIWQLAKTAFDDFFAAQKIHYPQHEGLLWHISGSVAYHFQEVIRQAAADQQCELGTIVVSPMEKLIEYYKNMR